jgi:NAD(P)-dependent dehydrogenase (short-subunit alcohol dehydrogenase family)
MADKIVLMTGGTGGIGKATAIGLATMGARVGITGRHLARAEQAAPDIRTASNNSRWTRSSDSGHTSAGARLWQVRADPGWPGAGYR